jgi:hypothetical protein
MEQNLLIIPFNLLNWLMHRFKRHRHTQKVSEKSEKVHWKGGIPYDSEWDNEIKSKMYLINLTTGHHCPATTEDHLVTHMTVRLAGSCSSILLSSMGECLNYLWQTQVKIKIQSTFVPSVTSSYHCKVVKKSWVES